MVTRTIALVFVCLALGGCGDSGDGDGGNGGNGGNGNGDGPCGDYGKACQYQAFCYDVPAGKQDVCESQNGTWLGTNCPKDDAVACCAKPVPGTSGKTISYYYAPTNPDDIRPTCQGGQFEEM